MSAQASRRCKGCRAEHQVTEEWLLHLLSTATCPTERRVSDGIYADRLFQCSRCPRLQPDGFTCSLCGCIIRVMARDREPCCPWPGAARWGRVAAPFRNFPPAAEGGAP